MAELTIQDVTEAGLSASYASAAALGDTFDNASDSRTFLHVINGDVSSHTVTVAAAVSSKSVRGFGTLTKADVSVAVPAGEERFIGPFPYEAFGATPDISYDDVTSVTIAALRVPS